MVGREAELARMRAALDGLESGTVLGVEGEPGIGKTRLLAELATEAEERHFLVLEGRASEGELSVPFAPFLDALDDYLASVNPRSLKPADAEGRAELARIFPSLAELAEDARDRASRRSATAPITPSAACSRASPPSARCC